MSLVNPGWTGVAMCSKYSWSEAVRKAAYNNEPEMLWKPFIIIHIDGYAGWEVGGLGWFALVVIGGHVRWEVFWFGEFTFVVDCGHAFFGFVIV